MAERVSILGGDELDEAIEHLVSVAKGKPDGSKKEKLELFLTVTDKFALGYIVYNYYIEKIRQYVHEDEDRVFLSRTISIYEKVSSCLGEAAPDREEKRAYLEKAAENPLLMLERLKYHVIHDVMLVNGYRTARGQDELELPHEFDDLTSYQEISDFVGRFLEETQLEPIRLSDLRKEPEDEKEDVDVYEAFRNLTRENAVEEYLRDVIKKSFNDAFYHAPGIELRFDLSDYSSKYSRDLVMTLDPSVHRIGVSVLINSYLEKKEVERQLDLLE